jgi:DDE superfamily endonuclease
MSNLGQPIRIKFIPSIAFSVTRQRPAADRLLKPPSRNWTKVLETRYPVLKARRVKALDWNRHEKNIYEKVTHWFEVIGKVLQDPAILAENVYNMDETGVMLSMPGSVKVLVGKDDKRDYRGARVKRIVVTAIECISADGRYLNLIIIWPATTYRSNWTTFYTPRWQYVCSESGYTDSKISLEWLMRIFDPETKERANKKPRVLICDGFGTHETLEILEFCFDNNILLCRLPSYTSHKLQPCNVAVFAPLKDAYREQADRLEQGGVNTIGKQHFTSLFSPARVIAFTPKNIKAGFAASGLFPFNPDRVLRSMPKPLAKPAIPRADEVKVGSCRQDVELQTPETPVTPVSAEALMSLQNLIIQRDAHALDETSKQNLARHMQIFVKAF